MARFDSRRYPPAVARSGHDLRRPPGAPRATDTVADQVYAAYYALQAAVGVGLWVLYAASPTMRSSVALVPGHPSVTTAFAYPDLLVIVVGSLLSTWSVARHRRSAVAFTAFTAGAVLYPTVYLIGWLGLSNRTGAGTLAIMIPPALLSSWIAWQVWRTRD